VGVPEFRHQTAENGPDTAEHILPRGLGGLHVHIATAVLPDTVQFRHQRQQCRGLTGLAGGVECPKKKMPIDIRIISL